MPEVLSFGVKASTSSTTRFAMSIGFSAVTRQAVCSVFHSFCETSLRITWTLFALSTPNGEEKFVGQVAAGGELSKDLNDVISKGLSSG